MVEESTGLYDGACMTNVTLMAAATPCSVTGFAAMPCADDRPVFRAVRLSRRPFARRRRAHVRRRPQRIDSGAARNSRRT